MSAAPVYGLSRVGRRRGAEVVLDIAALEVAAGEVLCLVGPTGAGKTTMLRILAGVEAASSGELRVRGNLVGAGGLTLEEQRTVAMVFQRPLLLDRTVRDNVAYGLVVRGKVAKNEQRALVDAVLRRLGLEAFAERRARSLSGGETHLVALARSLVLDPTVLLLDEPTANLDPARVTVVEKVVRAARDERGTTVVWATHNLFQARRCADRVALLLDGRLVEVAPAAEFFDAPKDARTRAFVRGEMVY
jgi:tungstate transport system ATP-binding protein